MNDALNIALWVGQGLLALVFLMTGIMKIARSRRKLIADPRMGWAKEFSSVQIRAIGAAEALGAVGLVVPWWTGIVPLLTPIAALGLVATMVGAIGVHVRRKEPIEMPAALLVIALLVAVGRFL